MADFPEQMQIDPATTVDVWIPSWHINRHGEMCRKDFCFGYTKGVGRTCGEEVETSWSHTNPLAPSVREMAPAARHDTLDNHWNSWNFHKIIGFRKILSFYIIVNLSCNTIKRYPVCEAFPGGSAGESKAYGYLWEVLCYVPTRNGCEMDTDGRVLGSQSKGTKSIQRTREK